MTEFFQQFNMGSHLFLTPIQDKIIPEAIFNCIEMNSWLVDGEAPERDENG